MTATPPSIPFRRLFATVAAIDLLVACGHTDGGAVPTLQGRVTDLAGILTPEQRVTIAARLEAYEHETTRQIAVLTVPSVGGESIEALSWQQS